ncbi:MAG: 50S ribosomal protein L32 [Selenomonadaceae bacterium]|nr:50S ribosomal protein L32 [Selenomonadaceae bacterium]
MAVPKKHMPKSSTRKRRSTWKLDAPNYIECPHCHEPKLPHHVCPECGYYKGRQVIETE